MHYQLVPDQLKPLNAVRVGCTSDARWRDSLHKSYPPDARINSLAIHVSNARSTRRLRELTRDIKARDAAEKARRQRERQEAAATRRSIAETLDRLNALLS